MNNLHGFGFENGELRRHSVARYTANVNTAAGLLSAIPPERVGLDGQYDHFGLVKRVDLALRQSLGDASVAQLEIAQRGKVVVFRGKALDDRLVRKITCLALAIDGADWVEVVDSARQPQVA
jgi:hypothetical protein